MIQSRMKKARIEANLTKRALAKKISVSESYVGLIERGLRRPNCTILYQLAMALSVSTDWLLGRDAPDKDHDWQIISSCWLRLTPDHRRLIAKIAKDNAK